MEIRMSADFAVPADSIWRLLADFGNIQGWWPQDGAVRIADVQIEGHGIGMIRHILNHGARHRVSERLDFLDSSARTLVLSIIGTRPSGITAYIAEANIVELDASHCRMDYRALVTVTPGREQQIREGLAKTYEMMFAGLRGATLRSG